MFLSIVSEIIHGSCAAYPVCRGIHDLPDVICNSPNKPSSSVDLPEAT